MHSTAPTQPFTNSQPHRRARIGLLIAALAIGFIGGMLFALIVLPIVLPAVQTFREQACTACDASGAMIVYRDVSRQIIHTESDAVAEARLLSMLPGIMTDKFTEPPEAWMEDVAYQERRDCSTCDGTGFVN